jgi:hypothetical protein
MAIENTSQKRYGDIGNIGALDVDDQTKSAIKKSLIKGVDPAQLKYFKQVNKDALSQALPPPPPPPTAVESVEPTADEVMQQQKALMDAALASSQSKGVVQNAYESVGNYLWGSPQMRGHIK